MRTILTTLFLKSLSLIALTVPLAWADYSDHPAAQAVIQTLVSEHGFSEGDAKAVLAKAQTEQRILDSMANAAEKTKTWTAYRDGFVSEFRVRKGREFLSQHAATFDRVEAQYGVPREMITAILGVETNYGGYTGKANVLNALATLAFDHPRRGKFFSSELVEYLVLCRDRSWAAEQQLGSYAGAMGWSQFMPSNYRRLAVDGNGDGVIDLHVADDAIASIANYFVHHGWQRGAPVASRAAVNVGFDAALIDKGLKPRRTVAELERGGFFPQQKAEPSDRALILRFNDADGDEFWFGYQNFYVISRYNPRSKYAMAVYHLSLALQEAVLAG